ncbi:hypothetical protein GLOIN_2v1876170 [Rhizophagus clarus]|uniref:Attractin/MKLN-like beta-propeller domain-containing protein n=1 Tax=Rhizophagus clarus TaxID=94130 RepID=A0A8H3QC13_9GLOM|nr:hypothetical protein GLOIN_2v1876170 [Rhizophagus clarus]
MRLGLLLFITQRLFFEVESYTPIGRLTHSSVFVGNNLYFLGGQYGNGSISNEVFYLNLSQSFDVANPPWVDLTSTASIPFGSYFATVASNNVNNSLDIYLFGGVMIDIITQRDSFTSFVYKFNVNTSRWNVPSINGVTPKRRRKINGVIDDSGKIYIYGGVADLLVGSSTSQFFDDLIIFNTIDSLWSISSSSIIRASYSATLLTNGIIVYIGGHEDLDQIVDISKIVLYDTKSSTWTIKTAKLPNQMIDNRSAHTAVLAPNNKIIVFGGSKIANEIFSAKVSPDIIVLNTETEPFEWTTPTITSSIGTFPSLKGHTANLVGNYMIVAFGNITQPNAEPSETNSNIYLMDIRNFTWVNSFQFEPHADNSHQSNEKRVIAAAVIGVIVTVVVIIGAFLIYKWVRKSKSGEKFERPNPDDHSSRHNQGTISEEDRRLNVIEDGRPNDVVDDGRPNDIVDDGRPNDVVDDGRPNDVVDDGRPNDVVDDGRPNDVVDDGRPNDVVDDGRPNDVVEDGRPNDVVDDGRPNVVEDGRPNDVVEDGRPNVID